jgi:hypothetical protein
MIDEATRNQLEAERRGVEGLPWPCLDCDFATYLPAEMMDHLKRTGHRILVAPDLQVTPEVGQPDDEPDRGNADSYERDHPRGGR